MLMSQNEFKIENYFEDPIDMDGLPNVLKKIRNFPSIKMEDYDLSNLECYIGDILDICECIIQTQKPFHQLPTNFVLLEYNRFSIKKGVNEVMAQIKTSEEAPEHRENHESAEVVQLHSKFLT